LCHKANDEDGDLNSTSQRDYLSDLHQFAVELDTCSMIALATART
jgi:hypothetical protein